MLTAALIVRPARRRSWLKASSPDHRVGRLTSLGGSSSGNPVQAQVTGPVHPFRTAPPREAAEPGSPGIRLLTRALQGKRRSGYRCRCGTIVGYFGPGGAAEAETRGPGPAGGLPAAGRAGQVALRSAGTSAVSCWGRRPAPASLSATRSSQDPAASEVTTESITRLTKNVSLMIPVA